MKNKTFTIGLVLLIAGSMAFTSCTKGKTNKAPEPDKELDSSTDVAKTTLILSDIMEICAQGCDGNLNLDFYKSSGANTSTITPNGAGAKTYVVNFNNTKGLDGKTRSGSIIFNYSMTPVALVANYYREPQWRCEVTLNNYVVDDYTVTASPGMMIMNTTATGFAPANTNLKWSLSNANVTVATPTASGSGITTVRGTLNKELLNTSTPAVYVQTGGAAIVWTKALVNFTGNFTGELRTGANYTLTIPEATPLFRNYPGCTPEKFINPESHPFVSGVMNLNYPPKSSRTIDYGQTTCDYNLSITIEGITYEEDQR